jgi:ribosomal protein S18 acetylase RimI-like enzyme
MGRVFCSILERTKKPIFPTTFNIDRIVMHTRIRRAISSDANVIAEFNALMAEETEHRTLDRKTLLRGVKAILNDLGKGIYFVAEAGGNVVGQLMITYEWSDWRNGNFWWIQSVYIQKEFRQQGVFRSLYEHVEKSAKKRKDVCGLRLYVERQNERAQTTYEKMGMKRAAYEMFEKDFVLA